MSKTERFAQLPFPASYDYFTPCFKTQASYSRNAGGGGKPVRWLLALISIAIFLPLSIHAQQALDPGDEVIVMIKPKIYDPNGSNTCGDCCYPITCRRALYQVSLKIITMNDYNGGDFDLLYEQLSVTVQALIDPGNVSKLNIAETESCIDLDEPTYSYSVDGNENSATLLISDAFVDEIDEELPTITFTGYESPVLFTLVVDCFPGEPTGAIHTDFLYVYDATEITSASGSSDSAPPTYPEPANANTDFTLSLGEPTCYDEFAVFPVLLTSSVTEEIEHLDFSLEFTTDVALDGLPDFDDILGGTTPDFGTAVELPADGGYAYLVSYTGETLTGTGLTLFTIKVPTPVLLSAGYDITATLRPGRLVIDDTCEKPAIGNDEEQCEQEPVAECDPADYTVLIQTELNPINDCELTVYVYFDWDSGLGATETFDKIDLSLEFVMPAGVTMTDLYTSNMTEPMDNSGTWLTPGSPGGNTVGFSVISTTGITLTATNSVIVVVFEAPTGCIDEVKVRRATLQEESEMEPCIPVISNMSFPYCTPLVQGNIVRENGCYLDEVTVDIEPDPLPTPPEPLCQQSLYTTCEAYSACVCPGNEKYLVTPRKDNDPLNGVSTFDLVLINKHILGIEALDSPYKIIAADANKSDDVTTFDIVNLRKLILGIYDEFNDINAEQTSWRFVPLVYEFPDENDPFGFPEFISDELPITDADFVAIKVGDVNNSNTLTCPDCDGPQPLVPAFYQFNVPDQAIKAGQYVTIPLLAAGESSLIAFQLSLRFDPRLLEFTGPSAGDIPGVSPDNFGLTRISEGELRMLWMARPGEEDDLLQAGQRVCFLTFRAKRDLKNLAELLQLDHSILPSLAWTDNGAEYTLQLLPARSGVARDLSAGNTLDAQIRPNPTDGAVSLHFALPESGQIRLSVYDAYGVRVLYRDLELHAGEQMLGIPEAANWTEGVYSYDLRAGKLRAKGHVVRQ